MSIDAYFFDFSRKKMKAKDRHIADTMRTEMERVWQSTNLPKDVPRKLHMWQVGLPPGEIIEIELESVLPTGFISYQFVRMVRDDSGFRIYASNNGPDIVYAYGTDAHSTANEIIQKYITRYGE